MQSRLKPLILSVQPDFFCMKLAMSCNPGEISSETRIKNEISSVHIIKNQGQTLMHFSCGGYSGSPQKKAVDQLLEDRQCDASKPRKETVANYVLGQRIMCPF